MKKSIPLLFTEDLNNNEDKKTEFINLFRSEYLATAKYFVHILGGRKKKNTAQSAINDAALILISHPNLDEEKVYGLVNKVIFQRCSHLCRKFKGREVLSSIDFSVLPIIDENLGNNAYHELEKSTSKKLIDLLYASFPRLIIDIYRMNIEKGISSTDIALHYDVETKTISNCIKCVSDFLKNHKNLIIKSYL